MTPSNGVRSATTFAGFATGPIVASLVGVPSVQRAQRRWYLREKKPSFQPPSWLFGPVWTALYTMMTVSAQRVLAAPASAERTRSLRWWWTQMALNAAWSPLFFGKSRRGRTAALADVALLVGSIGGYLRSARRIDPKAAWLMVPYLGWTMFATLLTAENLRLNPKGSLRFLPRPR